MAKFIIEKVTTQSRLSDILRADFAGLLKIPMLLLVKPAPFTCLPNEYESYRAIVVGYRRMSLADIRALCFNAAESPTGQSFVMCIEDLTFSDVVMEDIRKDWVIENLKGGKYTEKTLHDFILNVNGSFIFHYPIGTAIKDKMKITATTITSAPMNLLQGKFTTDTVSRKVWLVDGFPIYE